MNDDQYKRYRKAKSEPIKIIYKTCKDSTLHFLVSGTRGDKYKVTIGGESRSDSHKSIKCTCPDSVKRTEIDCVCKHCAFVLQQLGICDVDHPFWCTHKLSSDDAVKVLKSFKNLVCGSVPDNPRKLTRRNTN